MADTLPEPPSHLLVRTTGNMDAAPMLWTRIPGRTIWRGVSTDLTSTHVADAWPGIAAGHYGPIELLVPIAYQYPDDGDPARRSADRVVEAVIGPVGEMLRQLAVNAGVGIMAVVGEECRTAYAAGVADERAHGDDQAAQ